MWSGHGVNSLDIAPRYAGIVYGISSCVAVVSGIVSPLLTGMMTKHGTIEEWRRVFFICCGIYLLGTVFFILFASEEKQPWNDEQDYNKEGENVLDGLLSD